MSEKTETIEDRAWNALNTIKHVTRWLKERADVSVDSDYGWRANYSALKSTHKILDDLMAEREIVREQFADYDEMIRREKQRRNPEYQKSLPTVDDVTGILKEAK